MNRRIILLLLLILIVALSCISFIFYNSKFFINDEDNETLAIYEKVKKTVVTIECIQEDPINHKAASSIGSGFIIEESGLILTANHVIKNAKQIWIYPNAKELPWEVVVKGYNADLDVALLKPKNPHLSPKKDIAILGNSDLLNLGELVWAIGSPLGFSDTITEGRIINKDIIIPNNPWMKVLLSDVVINRGNSGGLMVNRSGEVIGINISVAGGEAINKEKTDDGEEKSQIVMMPSLNLTITVPINSIKRILSKLKAGASTDSLTTDMVLMNSWKLSDYDFSGYKIKKPKFLGPIILKIRSESKAEIADLQPGDLIMSINGKIALNTIEVAEILFFECEIGDQVQITILRDDQYMIKILK